MNRFDRVIVAVLLCTATAPAYAQTAAVPLEDSLVQYEAAVAADSNAQAALVKAALAAVTIAEYQEPSAERDSLFARAVRHARRAVALNSADPQAHFALARALGRFALTQGVREQARLATEIRSEALAALAIDPDHAGAHHVLGLWHKTVMKLNSVQRLVARTFLGAKGMSEASWDQAISHLEAAVRSEPDVMVHRLNLGRLYVERKRWDDARTQLQWVLQAPTVDYNDENYQREAEKSLKKIPQ